MVGQGLDRNMIKSSFERKLSELNQNFNYSFRSSLQQQVVNTTHFDSNHNCPGNCQWKKIFTNNNTIHLKAFTLVSSKRKFPKTPVARVLPQHKASYYYNDIYDLLLPASPEWMVSTHAPQRTQFVYHDGTYVIFQV